MSSAPKALNILLVEDTPSDVFLCKYAFKTLNPNCNFTVCDDGEQAINVLRKQPTYFHLIILDINIPKVNGIEVLRIIRETPETSAACVAVYSTLFEPSKIKAIYQSGADYFMTKPFGLDENIAAFTSMYDACIGRKL